MSYPTPPVFSAVTFVPQANLNAGIALRPNFKPDNSGESYEKVDVQTDGDVFLDGIPGGVRSVRRRYHEAGQYEARHDEARPDEERRHGEGQEGQ
jgi:hypothetical protein